MNKKIIMAVNIEMEYLKRSYLCLIAVTCIILYSFGCSFFQYESVMDLYDSYNNISIFYEDGNLDKGEYLDREYSIDETDGAEVIKNPLMYFYAEMCKAIYSVSPKYGPVQALEIGIAFFPFIFVIIGSGMMVSDYKTKIIKHKILRFGRGGYAISKLITMFFIICSLIIGVLLTSKIFSLLLTGILARKIPFDEFNICNYTSNSSFVTKVIITLLISLFFCLIGALFGVIFRKTIPAVIVSGIYLYIIPVRFVYEPKNIMYSIMNRCFDFYGIAKISSFILCNFWTSMIILLLSILFLGLSIILVIKERSAYIAR
ncbi:hypothetical protein D6853_01405 [Butyrivibrio sp. X503]|nr:hypothetical protein D6853_01405 [Butyrivibrio sp. X503]